MAAWQNIIGKAMDAAGFDAHVRQLSGWKWHPQFITLHNSAIPSLAQRPDGFTRQHIDNLASYYQRLGWRAGPHLFIDDRQIWLFSSLTLPGRHSPSWNRTAIGVEMLGDYAREDFLTGRGAKVRALTISALASLSRHLSLAPETLRLHKEDPATSHDCPGKNVDKAAMIADVRRAPRI